MGIRQKRTAGPGFSCRIERYRLGYQGKDGSGGGIDDEHVGLQKNAQLFGYRHGGARGPHRCDDDHPAAHVASGRAPDAEHHHRSGGPAFDVLCPESPRSRSVPYHAPDRDPLPSRPQRVHHESHPAERRCGAGHQRLRQFRGGRKLRRRRGGLSHSRHHPVRRHHQGIGTCGGSGCAVHS